MLPIIVDLYRYGRYNKIRIKTTIRNYGVHTMTLNFFKDVLFDELNECSRLPIRNITAIDKVNIFIIEMTDGSIFVLHCSARDKKTAI